MILLLRSSYTCNAFKAEHLILFSQICRKSNTYIIIEIIDFVFVLEKEKLLNLVAVTYFNLHSVLKLLPNLYKNGPQNYDSKTVLMNFIISYNLPFYFLHHVYNYWLLYNEMVVFTAVYL